MLTETVLAAPVGTEGIEVESENRDFISVTIKTENGPIIKDIDYTKIKYINPHLGGCKIFSSEEDGSLSSIYVLQEFEEIARRIKRK